MDVKQKKIDLVVNGFRKIASVIDGNLSYSYILGHRLKNPRYKTFNIEGGEIENDAAIKFLVDQLKWKKKFNYYELSEEDKALRLMSYGKTNNNKKEIDFFEISLKSIGVSVRQTNIAEKNMHSFFNNHELGELSEILILAVKKYFSVRVKKANLAILHQFLSYIFSLIGADKTLQGASAKVLLLPNDHSPTPVAFFVMAKIKNIKTVYLQHAEVTKIFPANDFDYSVLRNKKSLNVYNEISPVSGKVAIVSRDLSTLCLEDILKKQKDVKESKKVDVCIYPSSVLNYEVLENIFDILSCNEEVNNIFLKPHPAIRDHEPLKKLGYKVLEFHLNTPHLSIVGNSSVVIELIARGCLVYQCFKLDDIEKDYYGFCQDGLAKEIEIKDLNIAFWQKEKQFTDALAVVYQSYFPNLDPEKYKIQKAQYEMLLAEIALRAKLINGEEYVELCARINFRINLFIFTHAFLNNLETKGFRGKGDSWIIKEMNVLFDNREADLARLYKLSSFRDIKSIANFWMLSKKIEWNGYVPSYKELNSLIEYSQNAEMSRKAGGWVELKVFDIMLRHSDAKSLESFLEKCKYLKIDKIGVNKKVAFIRYVNLNKADNLEKYLVSCNENLSRLDKLKIEVQCFQKENGKLLYDNYLDVEKEFLESLPVLKDEYLSTVGRVYKELGERVRFIDVKRNKSQRYELNSMIVNALKEKKGFSLIRLSDGEGFLFQNDTKHFTEEDSCNRQRHWWGVEINKDLKNKIISESKVSIENSDIIGIPSVYRFLRDHSNKSSSLTQNLQGRGLLSVLEGISSVDTGKQLFTDDKVNLALFNDLENLKSLSRLARKIIIVNSATEEAAANAFKSLGDFVHIQIPTHYKTATNEKYAKTSKQLPFVYKEIYDNILNIAKPGDLVLVGAGVAGKVFTDAAKRNRAVGLDIGSAMDELVGGGIHSLF